MARKINNRDFGSYVLCSFLEGVGGFFAVFADDVFIYCWYYLSFVAASSAAINLRNTCIVIHASHYSF